MTDDARQLDAGELVAGRYRVVRKLGAGGMGTVYEAEHTWTKRRVALKVLRPELSSNERTVSRFLREARACTRLSHPHVVQVLDMGQDEADGALFLAQDLLDGADLRAVLSQRKKLTAAEALVALVPVAQALHAVHEQGVLHRDVKPENLFLHRDGEGSVSARVIDFGVARELAPDPNSATRTQLGIPVGTPKYMSPEQARGDEVLDARTDVWSLGAVLYEALCGSAPFEGATATVVISKILTQPPVPLRERDPSVPEQLARVVDAALCPLRSSRTASMLALSASLSATLDALYPAPDRLAALRSLRSSVDTLGAPTPHPAQRTEVSLPAPAPERPLAASTEPDPSLSSPSLPAHSSPEPPRSQFTPRTLPEAPPAVLPARRPLPYALAALFALAALPLAYARFTPRTLPAAPVALPTALAARAPSAAPIARAPEPTVAPAPAPLVPSAPTREPARPSAAARAARTPSPRALAHAPVAPAPVAPAPAAPAPTAPTARAALTPVVEPAPSAPGAPRTQWLRAVVPE